jgi:hypothetical protein
MQRATAVLLVTGSLVIAAFLAESTPAESNRVVESATGSGHMLRNGFYRTFSFSAVRYADGTSRGQLQLRSPEFDVVVHLEINCLRVVANRAHMSGFITRTSNPDEAFVGEHNRLVVEDNGEGGNAPRDMVSGIPANPGNQNPETCETNTLVPNRVVQHGNVQVR